MTHDKLSYTLTECRLLSADCPTCKQPPSITYEPGCTITTCGCGVFDALPDWEPRAAMRIFNACVMTKRMDEKNKQYQRKRIYEN